MKHAGLFVAVTLVLATSLGRAASPADTGNDIPPTTFRSGVDLVALNVVVTAGEDFVGGLTADHFAVYEDGIKQDVSYFAAGEVPLDLAVLIDTSASMTDKMRDAQDAAIGFVSTLRPGDRSIIVDIKDATRILSPLGDDLDAARQAIASTTARGGTALYNGLYLTIKEMTRERRNASDVRRQAIAVFSDGADTASLLAFDDVLDLAKRSGISIYTISLRSQWEIRSATNASRQFAQSEYAMRALAQETGARAFFPARIDELAGVYDTIAEELASQYALGYTSKNPKRDGAYRRVIVRVLDPAGAKARTRAGYVADGAVLASR